MLNFRINIVLVIATLVFGSCEMRTPEYYYTEGGLKYKYHDIVSDGKTPDEGDFLSVNMMWKTASDSIFYSSDNSTYRQTDLIVLQSSTVKGGIEEGFAMLKEGDSVTFYIAPEVFFGEYLKQEVPYFLAENKEMQISMRLLKIQSEDKYNEDKQIWLDQLELKEFSLINDVLDAWENEGDSIFQFSGVYVVYDSIMTDSNYVRYMDNVQINYTAEFTNGVEFYNTYNNGYPDEFQIGKPDQTVEGLKKAISSMRYGQSAKVLIPSSYGFGEKGSAGNIVPPYTPVIYRIEVLEKENVIEEVII